MSLGELFTAYHQFNVKSKFVITIQIAISYQDFDHTLELSVNKFWWGNLVLKTKLIVPFHYGSKSAIIL